MSAVNVLTRPAVSYIGLEVTHGTTPSMTRMTVLANSFDVSALSQTELDVDDERANLFDYVDPAKGMKSGSSVKFAMLLRPPAAQLAHSIATSTHYFGLLAKALLGTETAAGGTAVVASPSPTTGTFSVTSTEGSLLSVGQWALIEIGTPGSGTLEPIQVASKSSDAITTTLTMSGTPGTGAAVYGMYTYSLSQTNTQGLCLQHALSGDANHQWTINGCTGGLEIETARDGLVKVSADLKAASWLGPSAQSLTITSAAESMGAPFVVRDAVCLLQPVATTTQTHYPLHEFAVKIDTGMEHVPELGGVEGTTGVMRVGKRLAATATVKFRSDRTFDSTYWTSRTPMRLAIFIPQAGSTGLTKRWLVIEFSTCVIVGKPKATMMGERLVYEVTLHAKLDTGTSGSTADLALSPVRIAVG